MLKCVTCQCSMVDLNVNLKVFVKTICTEETNNCLCINVILMFCWLHWLRLNKESSCKAFRASIVACCCKHLGKMVFLTLHLCVKQAHVTFATTPEHVILTTEFDSSVDSILYLNTCTCYNVKVWICSSTVHITLVSKHICSTPQQLDVCTFHLLQSIVGDSLHA